MARKTEKSRSFRSSRIVIIGEGYTEQFYFKHLRSLNNYQYTIKPYFFGTTSIKEMDSKYLTLTSQNVMKLKRKN
jgi:hypothetical protein